MPVLPNNYQLNIPQATDFEFPIRQPVYCLPAPPFAASAPYVVGEYVSPSLTTGLVFMVVTAGTSDSVEPVWPDELGELVTSGTVVLMAVGATRLLDTAAYYAQLMIREEIGGASLLFMSKGNGLLEVGFSPPIFAVSTAYALGQQVVPITPNGWLYQCVEAGTSAGSSPTWGTVEGGVTTSNTATFRNVGSDQYVSNIRIALTPADTATDWDVGVYELLLTDAFGNVLPPILYGDARLIRDLISG